jgi:7-cyano-7-deazaguanine synthase
MLHKIINSSNTEWTRRVESYVAWNRQKRLQFTRSPFRHPCIPARKSDHWTMPKDSSRPTMGLLLSGGIDSAVLLDQLLERGSQVVPFYVRTGCVWDDCELAAVDRFVTSMPHEELADLIVMEMPLADLYGDHWSISGRGVPDDSTPDEAVFMPGRNPLLLIKPALWCQSHGVPS